MHLFLPITIFRSGGHLGAGQLHADNRAHITNCAQRPWYSVQITYTKNKFQKMNKKKDKYEEDTMKQERLKCEMNCEVSFTS